MRLLLIALLFLAGCGSTVDIPKITPALTPLTSLQQDVQKASESLSNDYKFNMSVLADTTQSDDLVSIVNLICKNLEQQTPRQDIESALLAEYGVVGSKDLIRLSIKHQCPQFS